MNCWTCAKKNIKLILSSVYKCDTCGHVYIDFKGDSIKFHAEQFRNVKKSRRDINEFDKDGNVTELFHEKRAELVAQRMGYIREILDKSYRCLDIGAGAGTFAKQLNKEVELVECTELTPSLVKECRLFGFKTYEEDFIKMDESKTYDIVFAWHVLEHVGDIVLFKEKLQKLARKYIVLEVPLLKAINGEGRTRTLKSPDVHEYDGHAHYFTKRSFTKFFEDDFNIVEIKEGVQSPALFSILEKK